MLIFDGLLHVHYGQAYVFSSDEGDTSEMDACFLGQQNGLLGAAQPGMLFLITGLHTGQVVFSVEVLGSEPPLDEGWEECVEASFSPAGENAQLVEWGGDSVCELPLSESVYRVRYVGRSMDAGRDEDTILEGEEPIDSYRLSFWPEPSAPDRVIKETSETARYWHSWARSL